VSEARPLPRPDRDSEPFWQALREHELRLQRCADCGALRWPPRAICNRCRSFEARWEELSGRGRVESWVRTHRAFAPAFRDAVPYCTVQVRLEEQDDLLLIGGWREEAEPCVGEAVRACFTPAAAGFCLLDWERRDR
jgi:uncharacterized OB-fold protein